jgi:uncharacterized protein YbbK (DUF523 family)/uncharacterized protein YbgA (DUF1722 family)
MRSTPGAERPIRIGISSCLLGNPVRFDGGHKRDRFVTEVLGRFVEWVPVCPEVELGMGTPRPPLRLVRDGGGARLVEIESGRDHTRSMQSYAERRVRALRDLDLCGYILKKDSPSCGMTGVKLYAAKGTPRREGRGLFASALLNAHPNLPVEEEGRLENAKRRESFVERVFAYRRLRDLFQPRWTRGQVVAFHTAHELQVRAHSAAAYRELGRLVASLKRAPQAAFRDRYARGFMAALARPASRGRNASALQSAARHLQKKLDPASRDELAALIHDYRRGLVPLVVPVTLVAHHVRCCDVDTLRGQVFLEPHPLERMLRNRV